MIAELSLAKLSAVCCAGVQSAFSGPGVQGRSSSCSVGDVVSVSAAEVAEVPEAGRACRSRAFVRTSALTSRTPRIAPERPFIHMLPVPFFDTMSCRFFRSASICSFRSFNRASMTKTSSSCERAPFLPRAVAIFPANAALERYNETAMSL